MIDGPAGHPDGEKICLDDSEIPAAATRLGGCDGAGNGASRGIALSVDARYRGALRPQSAGSLVGASVAYISRTKPVMDDSMAVTGNATTEPQPTPQAKRRS